MKQALITGGAGFLGSHLAELLVKRGEHVTVLDNESTGSPENLNAVRDHFDFHYVRGDVEDRSQLRKLLPATDVVYHFAGTTGVSRLAQAPAETMLRNLNPLFVLLDEIKQARAEHHHIPFFLASSCEVYGHNSREQWSEDDALVLGPTHLMRDAFAAQQSLAEYLTLAHARQYELPVVVGRIFPVIGPRQSIDSGKVLPNFVARALAGQPPVVYDDGMQQRTLAHVTDIVHPIAALMETQAAFGQVFNLGSDEPISMLELAERVVATIDPQLDIEFESYRSIYPADFADLRNVVPNLTKLRQTITYEPVYTQKTAIGDAIEWLREQ